MKRCVARPRTLRPPAAAIAAILAVLALCSGCRDGARGGRVLLIGIDGASPRLAFPMMEEGRLPNLAAIARAGAHGPLRSIPPLYSPRIWNTIATGRPPAHHGIVAFVKPSAGEAKRLYLSHDRRVPALWNILSAQGLTNGVVNWWTTYPPERIRGVMVSDHFFPEQIAMIKKTFKDRRASAGALVHPESWQARAEALLEEPGPESRIGDPFTDEALPHWVNREILSGQYRTDAEVTRVALGLQADHHPDVMAVFLPGIDRVSHWLWGNLEPAVEYPETLRPTDTERAAGAEALRRYYAYTDELIGLLARGYGPDDLVMVFSDHGFEAEVSLMLLTGGHESAAALDGVIFARGRGIAPGQSAGPVNVFDIAPSVLAWLGVPVAREMPGRPAPFLGVEETARGVSYDDLPVERLTDAASGREEEIVEHLRSLGYLDEPDLDEPDLEEPDLEEPSDAPEAAPDDAGTGDATPSPAPAMP